MAKPIHPSADSLRAGQTFYVAWCDGLGPLPRPEVSQIRVMDDSYPEPIEGEIIEAAPRYWIQNRMRNFFTADLYYSKRRAKARAKRIAASWRIK